MDFLDLFSNYLKNYRRLSTSTITGYLKDIRLVMCLFYSASSMGCVFERIDSITLRRIVEYLSGTGRFSAAYMCRMISSLRVYFSFLFEENITDKSPAEGLHYPKLSKPLPVFLVHDEVQRLLDYDAGSTFFGSRNRAIIYTFCYTGIRLSELAGIRTLDIMDSVRHIKITGKGNKERVVPIHPDLRMVLFCYLELRKDHPGEYLFINRFNSRLGTRYIEKMIAAYMLKAGIEAAKRAPHILRHTFATQLHMAGVDIIEIQNLLGHEHITTTQIYTHTDASSIESAVQKLKF